MTLSRRQFAQAAGGVAVLATLPLGLPARAAEVRPPAGIDPWTLVDPELVPTMRAIQPVVDGFHLDNATLAAFRQQSAARTAALLPPPALQPAAIMIARSNGPDVRVFVLNARPGTSRPVLLHLHGGGYIGGSVASYLPDLQRVAADHDCVIVSVDYRVAPEARFPGALDDNYTALKWVHIHSMELGGDAARIAIMGDSAGGGHAAALAIAARDRGEVPVVFQLLIYPMLDDRSGTNGRVPAHIGALGWSRDLNNFGWASLLGVPAGSATVPAGAVPARVANLAGLPPTFIGVGAIDLFVVEDVAYAARLLEAGVPTELLVVPGAYHGFDTLAPKTAVSVSFRAAWNTSLARAFARTSAKS